MIGRFFGWLVLGLAFLAASADAVLALGAGGHDTLATGEVLTLLAGRQPVVSDVAPLPLSKALTAWVLQLPAWMAMGGLGLSLLLLFRPKNRKMLFNAQTRRRSAR